MHRSIRFALTLGVLASLLGCGKSAPTAPPAGPATRSYAMGFSALPPRLTIESVLANWAVWSQRSDAAIFHITPPWGALLAGADPDSLVAQEHAPLARLYRDRGMMITVTLDATNGLNRTAEAESLVILGRSLTEPVVQARYRAYALAVWRQLHPDHLLLAAEVNLIRIASPAPLYAAVRQVCNDASAELVAAGCTAKRSVSVQVETVWGRLPLTGVYAGVATDLADFPFVQELGLSSYPYLGGFAEPESIPLDYYARIANDAARPVLVVEGGWSSASVDTVVSSPAEQARYVRRHRALLDAAHAVAVFQLEFADLDLTSFPPPIPPILPLFATLGLVDSDLAPKPALAAWDSVYARTRVP